MPIQTEIIIDRQLTIHTIQGELTFNAIMATLKAYNAVRPTTYTLWDFREADLTHFTADHIRSLVHFSTRYDGLRPGGHTALLIGNQPLAYSMARIAEIGNDVAKSDIVMATFRDYDEAIAWLEAGK